MHTHSPPTFGEGVPDGPREGEVMTEEEPPVELAAETAPAVNTAVPTPAANN